MQLVLDAHLHELVPSGVEIDLVDAVAIAVVGAQYRLVLVGESPPEILRPTPPSDQLAERGGALLGPPAALAPQRLNEREVGGEDVDALQGRGLVEDFVGLA